jgi:hypothetical protein
MNLRPAQQGQVAIQSSLLHETPAVPPHHRQRVMEISGLSQLPVTCLGFTVLVLFAVLQAAKWPPKTRPYSLSRWS